jgi:hypothetical protein
MKTMASTSLPVSDASKGFSVSGLARRVYNAILESRHKQADREIARMLHLNGDVLTDAAEREIERRHGFRF